MPLYGSIRFISVTLLLYLVSALTALAQNTPLRGRVSDETGAVIPGATITATDPTGKTFSTTSSSDGSYLLTAIPPGTYVVDAKFVGFFMKQPVTFVARGQAANLNLVLIVNPVVQQVTVKADESAGVSVDSSNYACAHGPSAFVRICFLVVWIEKRALLRFHGFMSIVEAAQR